MSDPWMSPLTLDPRALVTPKTVAVPRTGQVREAAREFEGLLMVQLFQTLRKTVEPSGLFGENEQARSTYEYLLDQALVQQAMASGKGWGLAERLERVWGQDPEKSALSDAGARDLKVGVRVPIEKLSR